LETDALPTELHSYRQKDSAPEAENTASALAFCQGAGFISGTPAYQAVNGGKSEASQDLLSHGGLPGSIRFPAMKTGLRGKQGERSPARESMPQLSATPELFPHGLDVGTDSLTLLTLAEADYAKASFLDARLLKPGISVQTMRFASAQSAVAELGLAESCQFIFHIGHVGSTLLSRLLGRHDGALALREPAILRLSAQMRAEPETFPRSWSDAEFEAHLSTLLKLWSRTFRPDQRAVVKATSFASELAAEILGRACQPKAIFMFVSPQSYLATILGAENSPREAQMLAPLRAKRLYRRIGTAPQLATSMGELVAMSWASEMTSLAAAMPASGESILWLDFDRFLANPQSALAACFQHLGIAASNDQIATILSGPDMRTYSKAQEYDYDAKLRRDVLAQAWAMHGAEIERGLGWLEKMSAAHPLIMAATKLGQTS